jgi:ribosomal protein S18 acetylase RimI-like enzyme
MEPVPGLSRLRQDIHAMIIRPAEAADDEAIWAILEPILRDGATYALPRDWSRGETIAYWRSPGHAVFAAVPPAGAPEGPSILGTYYLRANQKGGGAHVANCGYATHPLARRRGVARAMALHSLDVARRLGFTAMQFNFVVAANEEAVALWTSLGFAVVGRLPGAFTHPLHGTVDALVMHRML